LYCDCEFREIAVNAHNNNSVPNNNNSNELVHVLFRAIITYQS